MPTDNSSIPDIVRAINSIIQDSTDNDLPSLSHASRERLAWNAERLAIAAREPEENLYYQATQV